jgi:hypothetical protein
MSGLTHQIPDTRSFRIVRQSQHFLQFTALAKLCLSNEDAVSPTLTYLLAGKHVPEVDTG